MATAPRGLAVRKQKHYGWRPDLPDMRDYLFGVQPLKALPQTVSLRKKMPPVYDQGQLGSCTANSIAAVLEFNEMRQAEADATTPSRLFIYYNERAMEGTIRQDSGAEIRDGIKSVAQLGAPPEKEWPYVIDKFARKPPANSYREALSTRRSSTPASRRRRWACRACSRAAFRSRSASPSTSRSRATSGRAGSCRCPSRTSGCSAATRSSRSATRRSGASSTSSAATRGARLGGQRLLLAAGRVRHERRARERLLGDRAGPVGRRMSWQSTRVSRRRRLRGRRRQGDRVRRGDRGGRARRRRAGVGQRRRYLGRLDRRGAPGCGLRRGGPRSSSSRAATTPASPIPASAGSGLAVSGTPSSGCAGWPRALLLQWMTEQFAASPLAKELGKTEPTFADVRRRDLPPKQDVPDITDAQYERAEYRLHVIGSDVTTGRMIIVPDDLPDYADEAGKAFDKDSFPLVEAVRMSMSNPFLFARSSCIARAGRSTWSTAGCFRTSRSGSSTARIRSVRRGGSGCTEARASTRDCRTGRSRARSGRCRC